MATYTIRNTSVQDWRDSMMSKAQFNALAAERRANRAGSGFDEFGKHYTAVGGAVNDGMWTWNAQPNILLMGIEDINGTGTSRTNYPLANINGTVHKLYSVNSTTSTTMRDVEIILPPAPTVLPYDATLTTGQIAMGVIKHADSSNSGLIVNGKFDTDTSGWSVGSGGTISTASGKLVVTSSGSYVYSGQGIPTVVGKKYIVEFELLNKTAGLNYLGVGTTMGSYGVFLSPVLSANTKYTYEFIATTTTSYISFQVNGTASQYAEFDNIAVFPSDAISRSDLVSLESWHEDVSEKDFVYPLGNVQYLGTTGDAGTPVAGAFSGSGTYSLFGNWQASGALVGKGYVWSTLSDANKKAFVANHENNCYLDGDKVIQVRYRMMVVAGWGDSWHTTTDRTDTTGILAYTQSYALVKSKGKKASISFDLGSSDPTSNYVGTSYSFDKTNSIGAYAPESLNTLLAYEGKCFALPIALVHRRNQGIAHSVFNSNGSKLASDSLPWYSTTVSFTSLADCFDSSKLLTASGYIGTASGRPDGLFYDQVHEGDIVDLRMNSAKVEDYNRLIDREFNKLVAGTTRGSEGEWMTTRELQSSTNSNTPNLFVSNAAAKLNIGDTIQIFSEFDSTKHRGVVTFVGVDYITVSGYSFNRQAGSYVIISSKSTRTKSNTLTHTDIIGNPANYPTAWKTSGVSGVPLIVAEDGTSLLPTGTTGSDGLATFKLSHKFISTSSVFQVLKSINGGISWSLQVGGTHYGTFPTTNAITFTAGNIPLTTDLIMVTYQTHTGMVVPAVNSEVLAIGSGMITQQKDISAGVNIAQSLIGKVGVSGSGFEMLGNLANYTFYSNNLLYGRDAARLPVNRQNTGILSASPTVKTFPYLTRANGKARLQLVFKEMKHNGTTWGDHDNTFNIVDNVSTTTDGNGATILIGQKYAELPYFIGGGE